MAKLIGISEGDGGDPDENILPRIFLVVASFSFSWLLIVATIRAARERKSLVNK